MQYFGNVGLKDRKDSGTFRIPADIVQEIRQRGKSRAMLLRNEENGDAAAKSTANEDAGADSATREKGAGRPLSSSSNGTYTRVSSLGDISEVTTDDYELVMISPAELDAELREKDLVIDQIREEVGLSGRRVLDSPSLVRSFL